jgi:hypothetical protein
MKKNLFFTGQKKSERFNMGNKKTGDFEYKLPEKQQTEFYCSKTCYKRKLSAEEMIFAVSTDKT